MGDDDRRAAVRDVIRALFAVGGEEEQVEAACDALVLPSVALGQLVFLYEDGCDGGRFVLSIYGKQHFSKLALSGYTINIFRNEARAGVRLYIVTRMEVGLPSSLIGGRVEE